MIITTVFVLHTVPLHRASFLLHRSTSISLTHLFISPLTRSSPPFSHPSPPLPLLTTFFPLVRQLLVFIPRFFPSFIYAVCAAHLSLCIAPFTTSLIFGHSSQFSFVALSYRIILALTTSSVRRPPSTFLHPLYAIVTTAYLFICSAHLCIRTILLVSHLFPKISISHEMRAIRA